MRFNKELEHIATYQAGKPIEEVVRKFGLKQDNIIKLASNENPFRASPKVVEAIKSNAHNANLYPDDSMLALKEGLAKRFAIGVENLIIGSGSDQVVEMCVRAKENLSSNPQENLKENLQENLRENLQENLKNNLQKNPQTNTQNATNPQNSSTQKPAVLMAGITFAMYEIYSKIAGFRILRTSSDTHNLAQFTQMLESKPEIIFLCVPNNPLGECLDAKEVYEFLDIVAKKSPQSLVLIDGAYQEFARYKDKAKEISPLEIVERFSNAIYLGTFSKAYGLGGMRIGYGIANQNLISILHKVRPPFNITTLSLVAASEALKDDDFMQESVRQNFIQMQRYEDFAKSKGIDFIPSFTNFITLILGDNLDSSKICDWLLSQGIIIRNLASYKMNACRITIGLDSQNTRVLECLDKALSQNLALQA
ncbi:aminotransferase class I/II-fold pyridoxal phosphate-dependent enzyme [Helicobacter sp. T3_23-1056]